MEILRKRLSKYSTTQLLNRVEGGKMTNDEMTVALEIIERRTGVKDKVESKTAPAAVIIEKKKEDEITVEEVTAAIDRIYETEDSELILGMTELFKESIDDYSELSQEERISILKYSKDVTSTKKITKKAPTKPSSKKEIEKVEEEKSTPKKKSGKKVEDDPHPKLNIGDKVKFSISHKHKEHGGEEVTGIIQRIWRPKRQPDFYVRIRTELGVFDKRDHSVNVVGETVKPK